MSIEGHYSGFILVRKPEFNFETADNSYFRASPPKLGSTYYSGVDRLRWYEIGTSFYNKTLPDNLRKEYVELRELDHNRNYYHNLNICVDVEQAYRFLDYVNQTNPMNEIIVIYSELISEIMHHQFDVPHDIKWIGYDVFNWGSWSLIQHGIFDEAKHFRTWQKTINSYGLFDEIKKAKDFTEAYRAITAENGLETLPKDTVVDIIRVGNIP